MTDSMNDFIVKPTDPDAMYAILAVMAGSAEIPPSRLFAESFWGTCLC